MGEIKISKKTDAIFGNLTHITNGIIELTASLDFGPRILQYNLCDMENMLFNDTEKRTINDTAYPEYGGDILKVYGGHRLWISPEIMPRCYYPDNAPVSLTETKTGFFLEAPVETQLGIRKIIELRMNEYNSEVEVINTIKNVGVWDIVFAPWALTVMAQGGVAVVPQADRKTGLLNNRAVVLWSYTSMADERVYWGDKFIMLKQDPSADTSFKIGTNNEKGWCAYFNHNQLFVKQFPHVLDGIYPDNPGCSFETYTDGRIIELETLGQMGAVEPGDGLTHKEKWSIFKEGFMPSVEKPNEKKVEEVIMKHFL